MHDLLCQMTPVLENNIIKMHYTKMSSFKQDGKIEGKGTDLRSWNNAHLKK